MTELGFNPSWETVARHYDGLADGLLIDESETIPVHINYPLLVETAPIVMKTIEDRRRLGHTVLAFGESLRSAKKGRNPSTPVTFNRT
jgi:LPPG:FO 2-phospho-L-lactate transferase